MQLQLPKNNESLCSRVILGLLCQAPPPTINWLVIYLGFFECNQACNFPYSIDDKDIPNYIIISHIFLVSSFDINDTNTQRAFFCLLRTKTCSCPFVRYFRTLFWDDIMIICWWELSKQISYWSKTGFFSQLKKSTIFSSQIIVISFQNNVRKYRTKGHEQVFLWT